MRSAYVRILTVLLLLAGAPSGAFAQEAEPESPVLAILYTWAPLLLILGLWLFFMWRAGMGRKGLYSYMRSSQEKMGQIEEHLARISKSLGEIADVLKSRERLP